MDSDPIFVASAPPSVESARPSESVPSVVNLAGCSSVGSARDIVNSDRQPSASDIVVDEDRGSGDADAPELQPVAGLEQPAGGDQCEADGDAPVPAAVVSHTVRGDRTYGQGRPGPKHGRGGRKLGSGRHTKKNFGTAVRRVVGAYLCKVPAATLSSDCGISAEAGVTTIELLSAWAKAPGNEEVWLLPGMLGVVARWGEWKRYGTGDHASVCVWLAANGRCRCTCVGSNTHRDNNVYDRATTCKHAATLGATLEELSAALGLQPERVRHHLYKRFHSGPGPEGEHAAMDNTCFHVKGALYVAVCSSAFGALPVPLYLTHTRSSCSLCPGARTKTCSHVIVAQECGAPHHAHRTSAQSAAPSLEVSAISRLRIPLHNCVAAIRLNAEVSAKTVSGEEFVVPAPKRCHFCAARGKPHQLILPSTRTGAIACTRGFCKMVVHVAKCSSCEQWVCRDGREEHIVLLTMTSAATVTWMRSMAHDAADGAALTTSTTKWIRAVRRETVAGVLPSTNPTRSGRILRNIVVVGLKLMAADLPPELFTCVHCMDNDGRYKWVSADSIWVGFGSGADHVQFDHVVEAVPENRRAIRAAYLIRGESVRRIVRDVMKPKKDLKLLSRAVKPAQLAVGVLLPDALPIDCRVSQTAGEKAIAGVLGSIFDMNAAAAKLLTALHTGLAKYKTRSRVEAARRTEACQHLAAYINSRKSGKQKPSQPTDAADQQVAGAPTTTLPQGVMRSSTQPAGDNVAGLDAPPPSSKHIPAQGTLPAPPTDRSSQRLSPVKNPPAAAVKTPAYRAAQHARDTGAASLSLTTPAAQLQGDTNGASVARGRQAPPRQPDCGRKPFKAGKGDVEADSPFLRPAVVALDKDQRRELLSFVTAITIDSVVLPFRPGHAEVLRQLATLLDQVNHGAVVADLLARSTLDADPKDDDDHAPIVILLRELRFVQLGLRSFSCMFEAHAGLSSTLANGLRCVAASIDQFVAEWRNGPEGSTRYQSKWEGGGRSQADMARDFRAAYPSAARSHERTGTCAPSLPQCRPEPFLWKEVLSTGMCSKHYAKAHKFSPGAMTFCCGCKHPLIIAFSVLDRKEAPQVLLNMLLSRFARLPRFLIYDFSCGAFRVALGKLAWLLLDCTVVSDRFHIFNHLCSDAFDPRSYAKLDGVDSGAPEQRNAPIRRIQTTLQGMGVVPYTNLLAYQTAILNHEAQTKWALKVERLPDDCDLAGRFFTLYPCWCCDEPDPAADAITDSESSADDVDEIVPEDNRAMQLDEGEGERQRDCERASGSDPDYATVSGDISASTSVSSLSGEGSAEESGDGDSMGADGA